MSRERIRDIFQLRRLRESLSAMALSNQKFDPAKSKGQRTIDTVPKAEMKELELTSENSLFHSGRSLI